MGLKCYTRQGGKTGQYVTCNADAQKNHSEKKSKKKRGLLPSLNFQSNTI